MTRRTATIAAAALVLVVALPLMAQVPGGGFGQGQRMGGPGRGPGPGPMGIFPGLNQVGLSDAQREQLRGILDQERASATDPAGKARQAEEALRVAILADVPDADAVEAARATLNEARVAELEHRVELMQKIAALLTPAQRQQLAQLQPPPGPRGRGPGGQSEPRRP
jgi:Spy/CpxP family protein refolding chaperone